MTAVRRGPLAVTIVHADARAELPALLAAMTRVRRIVEPEAHTLTVVDVRAAGSEADAQPVAAPAGRLVPEVLHVGAERLLAA